MNQPSGETKKPVPAGQGTPFHLGSGSGRRIANVAACVARSVFLIPDPTCPDGPGERRGARLDFRPRVTARTHSRQKPLALRLLLSRPIRLNAAILCEPRAQVKLGDSGISTNRPPRRPPRLRHHRPTEQEGSPKGSPNSQLLGSLKRTERNSEPRKQRVCTATEGDPTDCKAVYTGSIPVVASEALQTWPVARVKYRRVGGLPKGSANGGESRRTEFLHRVARDRCRQ